MSNLKDLRIQSNKSQKEVATALGVSVQAISNYENSNRRLAIDQILPLAKLYDVTAEEIIEAALNSCPSAR